MGSSQLILVLGGIVLLSILSMNYYNANRTKQNADYYNQALITGTGIAQSLLDEIMSRAFDEKTRTKAQTTTDSLTISGSLGPDSGEGNVNAYDDVDDYKNYTRQDTLGILGMFRSSVNVYYISTFSPNSPTTTRTFSKRVDIKVTNAWISDTIKVNHIISY